MVKWKRHLLTPMHSRGWGEDNRHRHSHGKIDGFAKILRQVAKRVAAGGLSFHVTI